MYKHAGHCWLNSSEWCCTTPDTQQYLLSKPATRQTLTNTSHVTQRNDVIKHTHIRQRSYPAVVWPRTTTVRWDAESWRPPWPSRPAPAAARTTWSHQCLSYSATLAPIAHALTEWASAINDVDIGWCSKQGGTWNRHERKGKQKDITGLVLDTINL